MLNNLVSIELQRHYYLHGPVLAMDYCSTQYGILQYSIRITPVLATDYSAVCGSSVMS